MRKTMTRNAVNWLFALLVLGVGLVSSGCVKGTVKNIDPLDEMARGDSFIVSSSSLTDDSFEGADNDPKMLIGDGVRAWKMGSFKQAGDLLMAGYQAGAEIGWKWSGRSKVTILSEALRAYFMAGSVDDQKDTARFILSELSDLEQKYLPLKAKVLIYWTTMAEKEPAFEREVPEKLRIADYASLKNY